MLVPMDTAAPAPETPEALDLPRRPPGLPDELLDSTLFLLAKLGFAIKSRAIEVLEERGLGERRRDPTDRRRHTVSLTAEGKRQLVRLRAIVKRIEDGFLDPLDKETRTALHDALIRVACGYDCRFERSVA